MVLIEWRDEFCTGIKGIDYEHEKMIEQINAVYALIDDGSNRQLIIDSLGDIYGAISDHFALEEQMMQKHSYPHYKEHEAEHRRLLNDIGDITEDFESNDELDESLLKQTLADWFLLHFKTHDSRLHKLVHQSPHDRGDEPTIRNLIRNAKNRLLGKIRQRPKLP